MNEKTTSDFTCDLSCLTKTLVFVIIMIFIIKTRAINPHKII